jgi:hypothetical protein
MVKPKQIYFEIQNVTNRIELKMSRRSRKIYKKTLIRVMVSVIAIIVIILLPHIIELVISRKSFLGISFNTKVEIGTWINFIGSYLGALAAIILGLIALKQNRALSKANDKLSKTIEDYFNNEMSPKVIIKKTASVSNLTGDINHIRKNNDGFSCQLNEDIDNKATISNAARIIFYLKSNSKNMLTSFKVTKLEFNIGQQQNSFINPTPNMEIPLKHGDDGFSMAVSILYTDLNTRIHELVKTGDLRFAFNLSFTIKNELNKETSYFMFVERAFKNGHNISMLEKYLVSEDI